MLDMKFSKKYFICTLLISFVLPVHSMDWFYKNQKVIVAGTISICGLAGYLIWHKKEETKIKLEALNEALNIAAEDFYTKWVESGFIYTPNELEEMIANLMYAVSQPDYIEGIKPFVLETDTEYDEFEYWQKFLPLKYLSKKEKDFLYYFFSSLEMIIELRKAECIISTKHRELPSTRTEPDLALLSISNKIDELQKILIIGVIAEFAVYHANGLLAPKIVNFSHKCFEKIKLKWAIAAFVFPVKNNHSAFNLNYTFEKRARMKLIMMMVNMLNEAIASNISYENYVKQTTDIQRASLIACAVLSGKTSLYDL